jgi:very-short-patch-repair endonuclease
VDESATMEALQKARSLRRNMTDAERKLWYFLRGRRFENTKFKRQKAIGPYIVDFVAAEPRLIIELDGSQHQARQQYDEKRTCYLEEQGYRVLRFWDNDCLRETEAVLQAIHNALT